MEPRRHVKKITFEFPGEINRETTRAETLGPRFTNSLRLRRRVMAKKNFFMPLSPLPVIYSPS